MILMFSVIETILLSLNYFYKYVTADHNDI